MRAQGAVKAPIRIPVMPECMDVVAGLIGDETAGLQEWGRALSTLPVISARLISLANSPWSSPRIEVVTIGMACSRLGLNVVKGVCIAISISDRCNELKCPTFERVRFWVDALTIADLARRLAPSMSGLDAGLAYSAGLFHNLGLLLLADSLPGETDRALSDHADGVDSLVACLQRHCDMDHCEAGRLLGEAWGLPEAIVAAMRHHGDPEAAEGYGPLVGVIHLAARMNRACQKAMGVDEALAGVDPVVASTLERLYSEVPEVQDRCRGLVAAMSL